MYSGHYLLTPDIQDDYEFVESHSNFYYDSRNARFARIPLGKEGFAQTGDVGRTSHTSCVVL